MNWWLLTWTVYDYDAGNWAELNEAVCSVDESDGTLTISQVTSYGNYQCIVSDGYGGILYIYFEVYADSGLISSEDYFYYTVNAEESFTLDAAGYVTVDSGNLSYQWMEQWVPIEGATESSYTVDSASATTAYQCTVSDDYGNSVTLYYSVQIENGLTLTFEEEDSEILVQPHGSTTLTAYASSSSASDSYTFGWYYYDSTGMNYDVEDFTVDGSSSSLVLTDIEETRSYTCYVKDKYGNTCYQSINVRIDTGLAYDGINTTDVRVSAGSTAELDLSVFTFNVNSGVALTYQWYKDGTLIEDATDTVCKTDEVTSYVTYECRVQDPFGGRLCFYYYVTVDTGLDYEDEENRWFSYTVDVNASLELSVGAYCIDDAYADTVTYQWYNDVEIPGATGSTYTIESVTEHKQYNCRVYDVYGNWIEFYYYVDADTGLHCTGESQWHYYNLEPGDSATLTADAEANEGTELTYQWYDNDWNEIEGATASTYELGVVQKNSWYYCVVSDSCGNNLELYYRVYVDNSLSVSVENDIVKVKSGGDATLSVTATAQVEEGITYTWYWYYYDDEGDYCRAESTGSSLELSNITESKYYYCQVEDAYGNEDTATVHVTIDTGLTYDDPDNEDEGYYSYGVALGGALTLEAKATANDGVELTYQWYCDDGETLIEDATSESLIIDSVTERDWYSCRCLMNTADISGLRFMYILITI